MTGSGTKIQAGSLGNIKDLVRKANGTATDRGTWRGSFGGRAGGGRPPDKKATDVKATDQTTDQKLTIEEHNDEPKKEQEETAAKTERLQDANKTTQTQQAATSAPSKPKHQEKEKDDKPEKKPIKAKPSQKGKNAYKEINRQVEDFDAADIKGSRHQVFISDKNHAILKIIYGERKLSAILNVLAERHIGECKDDMLRSISDKSGLFDE